MVVVVVAVARVLLGIKCSASSEVVCRLRMTQGHLRERTVHSLNGNSDSTNGYKSPRGSCHVLAVAEVVSTVKTAVECGNQPSTVTALRLTVARS